MKKIVIKTIPACGQCKTVKAMLDKYKIAYDITPVKEPVEEIEYPIIMIDGKEFSYKEIMNILRYGKLFFGDRYE